MSAPTSPTTPLASTSDDTAAPAPQIHDHRDSITVSARNDAPDEDDTHRCFICLVDEPEGDIPDDWVTPCKCSLEGHQSCLLTWIADLEAQGKSVQCPLCKSKIEVVDRWDPAVQLSNALVRHVSGLSPVVLLSFGVGGLFMSSALYGMQSLEVFAGPESAMRYIFVEPESEGYINTLIERLRRALPALTPNDTAAAQDMLARNGISVGTGARVDWIHFFSLTLVAPALILNRMSLGGAVMIPSSLVYAMFLGDHKLEPFAWPPTPQKALLVYPVVRAFYFHIHRMIQRTMDQKLAALLQPQAQQGGTAEQADLAGAHPPIPANQFEDDNFIDLNFEINIGVEDEPAVAAPADDMPPNAAAAPLRPHGQVSGLSAVLNYFAGALMWPTISYSAGSLLRLALPPLWVTKSSNSPVTGILQERWGRSLVGGCLFVVLKDAFFLYVKWRTMVNRPYRRIRNVDRRAR